MNRNNVIFTAALWKLLDILSTWEKNNVDHHPNLTLELSAHSPSDGQHVFQNEVGLRNTYPYLAGIGVQRQYMKQHRGDEANDPFHSFEIGQSLPAQLKRVHMAGRLIPQPLEFDFFGVRFKRGQSKDHLPRVKTISSFLIRRQCYRNVCPLALGRLFSESLTNLRDIRHERWRLPFDLFMETFHDWTDELTEDLPSGLKGTLGRNLPASLESLHIFEDSKDLMLSSETSSRPRRSRIQILKGLATSVPGIKHLSVSFLSDAMACLEVSDETIFPNLQTIALTSQDMLRPTQRFGELLHKAALAAMKMPKLQIMEIWNAEDGHAAIIRYEAAGTPDSSACRLTFRCSWYLEPIQDCVVEAWRQVASAITPRQLIVYITPLPAAIYPQYGSVIGQLKLRNHILDDISQMQVRVSAGSEDELDVPPWRPATPYLPSSYGGFQ